jgi:Fic family protein
MFNLRAVNLAIRGLHVYLTKQQQEFAQTTLLIRKHPDLNHRQHDLLFHAVSDPAAIYTIKFQKNVHNVSYETARADLLELEKKGFLTRIQRKGKEFAFVPSKGISKKLKGLAEIEH